MLYTVALVGLDQAEFWRVCHLKDEKQKKISTLEVYEAIDPRRNTIVLDVQSL